MKAVVSNPAGIARYCKNNWIFLQNPLHLQEEGDPAIESAEDLQSAIKTANRVVESSSLRWFQAARLITMLRAAEQRRQS